MGGCFGWYGLDYIYVHIKKAMVNKELELNAKNTNQFIEMRKKC